jgi:Xaa-Pro aminopeptidase/Xaa-Pro dipeptidase
MNCDVLVSFEPENLFYMTGFWGEAVGILEKDGVATIIAPELEIDREKKESIDCNVIKSERGVGLLSSIITKINGKKVCTDCQNYVAMESLKKSIPSIKHSTNPFYRAREIKDQTEVSTLRKASKVIDQLYELCVKKIVVGQR